MKIAAHQPNYLPNLNFFSKANYADIFIVVTNLQADRGDKWQMRNRIATANGDMWLTVPTYKKHRQYIKDIKICYLRDWQRSHVKTLQNVYSKKKVKQFCGEFKDVYEKKWERLAQLNFEIIQRLVKILNIDTRIILDEETTGVKEESFIKLCKKYGADTYVSGVGAKNYMTQEMIARVESEGIKHEFIEKDLGEKYKYSTLHYLFTHGDKWIKDVI